jgi:hypothetical protein
LATYVTDLNPLDNDNWVAVQAKVNATVACAHPNEDSLRQTMDTLSEVMV